MILVTIKVVLDQSPRGTFRIAEMELGGIGGECLKEGIQLLSIPTPEGVTFARFGDKSFAIKSLIVYFFCTRTVIL